MISPVFLILLRDMPFIGFSVTCIVMLLSSITVAYQQYLNNYPASQLPWTVLHNYKSNFYEVSLRKIFLDATNIFQSFSYFANFYFVY